MSSEEQGLPRTNQGNTRPGTQDWDPRVVSMQILLINRRVKYSIVPGSPTTVYRNRDEKDMHKNKNETTL